MVANPLAAPRVSNCKVCTQVASPADVTIRLYDRDLTHLPHAGAIEYLRSVGMSGSHTALLGATRRHRNHIDEFIARDGATAPAEVIRIPAPVGDVGWVDVNQGVMTAGAEATAILQERIRTRGADMDTKDLTAIMNSGSTAASMRASAEMKGQLRKAEALAKLASGFQKAPE